MHMRNSGFAQLVVVGALVLLTLGAIVFSQSNLNPFVSRTNAASLTSSFKVGIGEDTYSSASKPRNNFGKSDVLQSGDNTRLTTYFKVNLNALRGRTITSAKLKLHVVSTSTAQQVIRLVTANWNESKLTYQNKPTLGSTVATFNTNATNGWVEIDFSQFLPAIQKSPLENVSFAITASGSGIFTFNSNDSSQKPYFEFIETITPVVSPSAIATPKMTAMASPTPVTTPSATTAPNGTSATGGFGVGSGDGLEVGINLAKFNQVKADAVKGVYDRVCTAAEHNKNIWHSLVNTTAKCHYDHEHGDDPNYVNDIFGEPGAWFNNAGQSISYPWQTFSIPANTTEAQAMSITGVEGQKENDLKHQGYFWVVRRGQTCDGGEYCITDSRLEFHFMSSHHNEVGVRFHSFSFEGRLCKNPNDPSTCGIYRTGGWSDNGQLFVSSAATGGSGYLTQPCWNLRNSDPIRGQLISLPTDSQFFPLNTQGLMDEFRCHKTITDSIVKAMPNGMIDSSQAPVEWWAHGSSDFRYVIRVFDPLSNVDTMTPSGVTVQNAPFCKPGDVTCRWNNSNFSAGQGYTTQVYEYYDNTPVDSDKNGKTDLTLGKVFMNRFGNRNMNCTGAGLDCIPLILTNVPLSDPGKSNQRYSNRQCEACTRVDHDLTPVGRPSWIQWYFNM